MKTITVEDKMQKGYAYQLIEPVGLNFDGEFKPELTPMEVLRLGVFGGKYLTDCQNEFPHEWFAEAILSPTIKNINLNYFAVDASQPLSEWHRKGWIHPQDPRGWFQWYCRYYMGRRTDDDIRQIRRWKGFKRHAAAVKKNCEKHDLNCRKKQRQALLHWAYDSRDL